jgi:hypothetical protein
VGSDSRAKYPQIIGKLFEWSAFTGKPPPSAGSRILAEFINIPETKSDDRLGTRREGPA